MTAIPSGKSNSPLVVIGGYADGGEATVDLSPEHLRIGPGTGEGKHGGAREIRWVADLKAVNPDMHPRANWVSATTDGIEAMLDAALRVVHQRSQAAVGHRPDFNPLIVVIEEEAQQVIEESGGAAKVERLARLGHRVGVTVYGKTENQEGTDA